MTGFGSIFAFFVLFAGVAGALPVIFPSVFTDGPAVTSAIASVPQATIKNRTPLASGLHTTRLKNGDVLVRWQYGGRLYDAVLVHQNTIPTALKKKYWVVSTFTAAHSVFGSGYWAKGVHLVGGALKPTQTTAPVGDYASLPSGDDVTAIIYLDRKGRKTAESTSRKTFDDGEIHE